MVTLALLLSDGGSATLVDGTSRSSELEPDENGIPTPRLEAMSRLGAVVVSMSVPAFRLDSLSDEQLLRRTAQDAEAFGVFYRRHVERVLRFFTARTEEPEHAADLMAETFAAAFTAAGRFRAGPEPPVAWLFVIAQRKLADARRRGRVAHRARARLALDPLVLDDADLAAEMRCSPLVVRQRVSRGLRRLRGQVERGTS